jgi:hypothetical protein
MKSQTTICVKCEKDRSEHSKKLWVLHQQVQLCVYCQKNSNEHSEKLWERHQLAVEKGQYCSEHSKNEKLYPITIGSAKEVIARVCRTSAKPPYDVDMIPIYITCTDCGLYLGDMEEEYADELDGMCLKCFREQTEQTHDWYDIPTVLKKEVANC